MDRYTKVILTVIAICLIFIVAKDLRNTPRLVQLSSGLSQSQAESIGDGTFTLAQLRLHITHSGKIAIYDDRIPLL